MEQLPLKQRFLDRSIFLKILSVIILSAIIVNVVVTIFFNILIFTPVKGINQFVFKCANYILDDLETSFDTEKAQAIAEDFGLDYRHEFEGKVTASSNQIPGFDEIHVQKVIKKSNQYLGFHKGKIYLILKRDFGTYIVIPKFYLDSTSPEIWIIGVMLLLSIIFIGIYHSLKKLLSPVHDLREGVEQVIDGNFDYRLDVKSEDELGKLTSAFNNMAGRVKGLLYSKEQLLLNVSHELRSPLTRMKLALEFLPDDSKKADILNDVQLMESMVSELLESAKLEKESDHLNLEKASLNKIIDEVCNKISQSPTGIVCQRLEDDAYLEVDRSRFKTVIKNLLENALKYSKDSQDPVTMMVSKTDKSVVMEIKDSGEGIPEKDLPFVFEPFYRVDKSRSKETGGYGLGLSICKQIIEAHKGEISICSNLGKGTTVTIEMPIVK